MRASLPAVLLLSALLPIPGLAAQRAPHPAIPIGARVKLPGSEGTLLAWRGDTLVVKLADQNDTVRIAATALNDLRVVESPALWRDSTAADINFYTSVLAPRSNGADTSENRYRRLLLVATATQLAGVDPATGKTIWARTDLQDLKGVALDFVGRTGYGIVTQGDRMDVVDLRTGQTRWDTRSLFSATRGWLPLDWPDTSILLLGRTAESPTAVAAVNLLTGKTRWRQDHLFGAEPKVFSSSGVSYLLGQQDPLSDTDSTLVLYISAEGPMRLDARTGALLWRSSALGDAKVPAPRDGYARMRARRGVIYIPSEKQLVAVRATDGRSAWDAPHAAKNKIIDMGWTPRGLLVRGEDWIDLLDPGTGKPVWRSPAEVKNSTRMVLRGDTIYIVADKKLLAIQVADGAARTLTSMKYADGELPAGFAVFKEGIVLNSWHHVTLFDRQGLQRNHVYYPSPKSNFGEALTEAGTGVGARRPVTMWGGWHIYFYTGAPDNDQVQGFSLVKFDPAAWREDGRIWFSKRVPDYLVDWDAGMVYYRRSDRELVALTFGDATALAAASHAGPAEVTRLLDMGADINAVGSFRWTALHHAAAAGQTDVARLLLSRGAQVDAQSTDGWTPWMVAAANGHADIMGLLQQDGARTSTAMATLLQGWYLSDAGRTAAADSAYAAARAQDSGLAIFPAAWRQLCWNEAVHGLAVQALAACEEAVQHTRPSEEGYSSARLGRGIARALAGNASGAADDLAASEQPTWDDEAERNLTGWIDALRAGTNPFTAAVLATLRQR